MQNFEIAQEACFTIDCKTIHPWFTEKKPIV